MLGRIQLFQKVAGKVVTWDKKGFLTQLFGLHEVKQSGKINLLNDAAGDKTALQFFSIDYIQKLELMAQ